MTQTAIFVDYDLAICDLISSDPERMRTIESSGLEAGMLLGDGAKVYQFIHHHFTEYGKVPDRSTIFTATNIAWSFTPTEPIEYYIDQVVKRHTLLIVGKGIQTIHNKVRTMDSVEAVKACKDLAYALDSMECRKSLDIDYALSSAARLAKYQEIASNKAGLVGFPSPWEAVNYSTGGVESTDLWTIVGRTGLGKTWLLCCICAKAMMVGKRALIVSKELGADQVAVRMDALLAGLPFDSVRRGMLSEIGERERYIKYLSETCTGRFKDKLTVLASPTVDTPEDLDFKIAQFRPDMVFVDGAYIMRSQNPRLSQHEQRAAVVQDLKFLAQKYRVPIVITVQFNRSAAGKAAERLKGGVENVAGSDAYGQWSDTVIGVYQNEELEKNNRLILRIIKNRNGLKGEDVPLHTDFTTMQFTELKRNISLPVSASAPVPAMGFRF